MFIKSAKGTTPLHFSSRARARPRNFCFRFVPQNTGACYAGYTGIYVPSSIGRLYTAHCDANELYCLSSLLIGGEGFPKVNEVPLNWKSEISENEARMLERVKPVLTLTLCASAFRT